MMMKKLNSSGTANLFVPLLLVIFLFVMSTSFGVWAFMSRQDYKDNVDEKIATAVEVAKKQIETEKDNEFIEREKKPLKEYSGPSSFGSVKIKYPKTWGAYVDEQGDGSAELDGYFHPNFVPGMNGDSAYALRIQVVNKSFDDEAKSYENSVRQGDTTAQPYVAVNVKDAVALRLDGSIGNQKNGTLIIIKLRDKTLKLWTESDQYAKDFSEHVLSNLTFSP